MNAMKNIIGLMLLLLASSTYADQSFDCSFPVQPVGGSVREVALTEDVYACMRKSNYRDLQLVNGDGHRIPFVIEHPVTEKEVVDFTKALKFNVDSVDPGLDRNRQLRRLIRLRSFVNDTTGYKSWNQQHSYLTVLILDNPETNGKLNRLLFDINNLTGQPLSATVVIEYSEDLIRWTSSFNPQKLFFSQDANSGFDKNQLVLGANRSRRYIRLAILSNSEQFVVSINQILAQYQKTRTIKPDFQWVQATSIQQLSDGQDWQFSVPAQLPVSQMRFIPGGDIVYFSGRLMQKPIENEVPDDNAYLSLRESKKNKLKSALKNIITGKRRSNDSINSGWLSVKNFHQYHFTDADQLPIEAEPIYFFHRPSRHWRIYFDNPTADMIASHFPEVEFGWTAANIKFLAQGPEPFILLVGSDEPVSRLATPNVLRSQNDIAKTALVLAPGDMNNRDKDSAQQEQSTEREVLETESTSNQMIIWLVLIAGVAIMGFMAWQLLGSIQRQTSEEDQE